MTAKIMKKSQQAIAMVIITCCYYCERPFYAFPFFSFLFFSYRTYKDDDQNIFVFSVNIKTKTKKKITSIKKRILQTILIHFRFGAWLIWKFFFFFKKKNFCRPILPGMMMMMMNHLKWQRNIIWFDNMMKLMMMKSNFMNFHFVWVFGQHDND